MIGEANKQVLAILAIRPNAQFVLGNGYANLNWMDEEQEKPTKEEFDEAVAAYESNYESQQYARDRQPEYPSMADQLDYIYHNGIAKWKSDMVKPVKDAHPKP